MLYVALTLSLIGFYGVFHYRSVQLSAKRPWSGDVRTDVPRSSTDTEALLRAADLAVAEQVGKPRTIESPLVSTVPDDLPVPPYLLRQREHEDADNEAEARDHAKRAELSRKRA